MTLITRLILIVCLLAPFRLSGAQTEWKDVERVVAVGDIHGDYNAFVEILRSAGVIDQHNHWIGGKTHLVQTGDVVDRGPDSRKIMDLLMDLEKEAPKAGGHVHALLGNHETMNLYGDLRYTSAGEFAAFATDDSQRIRASYWKKESKKSPRPNFEEQKKWEDAHPLGWVEQRIAFGPDGVYGKWIKTHNAVVKINDTIFMHGGISPRFASMSLKQINEAISKELSDITTLSQQSIVTAQDGPLWYRGLAQDTGPAIEAHVDQLLAAYGAKRIVVSHTVAPGAVIPRFGGKVVLIDVGISAIYGSHRAYLIIENGDVFAMHRAEKIPLPSDNPGLVAYFKRVLLLEPVDSPLVKYTADIIATMAPAGR